MREKAEGINTTCASYFLDVLTVSGIGRIDD